MAYLPTLGTTIALTLVLTLSLGEAGTLKVSPVKVFLPAGGESESIRIENSEPTPVQVQVEVIEWAAAEDLEGAKHAEDILAVPSVFEMAPDSEQIIRLAYQDVGSAKIEKAFRLLITEVPEDTDDGGISFAVRLNMPLFVTPKDAAAAPEWRLQYTERGEAALIVANHGNAHLMVKSLELLEAGSRKPVFETDEFSYVLAGKEQRWSLGYGQEAFSESLEVLIYTNLGLQQFPVWTE